MKNIIIGIVVVAIVMLAFASIEQRRAEADKHECEIQCAIRSLSYYNHTEGYRIGEGVYGYVWGRCWCEKSNDTIKIY